MSKKAKASPLSASEAQASVWTIRTSPRKLNLVAQLIRGKSAAEALQLLTFSKRRMANVVKKALQSAIANAENNHSLDVDRLVIRECTVGRTFTMKRFHARGRGKAGRIEKLFSNLRMIVAEEQLAEKPARSAKKPSTAKKADAPKAEGPKAEAKSDAKPAAKKADKKSASISTASKES